ncbi:uracil-DNA glycosylase [Pneumocystis jirovecii RU7]|uniref:Uracil-DNA glycosylase n=1 Tax=Pneumocystis jirovecii (strain RU7) TaxID=1408657 RepID=A0A0W4ZEP4_PNEJ7|nr:uracil-DNA glycosylase [Pneumocystis jirovecii RU7]KTW26852.1 uracil-DNA glycosylase [Pneumocystis jirovecii RU7]
MNFKKRKEERNPLSEQTNTEKRAKQSSMTSFFRLKNTNQTAITTKFNKQRWIEGLTEDQKELLKLEIEFLHESWFNVLKDEFTKPYFLQERDIIKILKNFLKQEKKTHTIFPPEKDIYSWSHYTPLNTVKVVILGQDPYHNYNQAHGLCFSVRPPTPPPPSLKNIFIALQNDYPSFNTPKNGLLTPWAKRGVLLLNSSLTVRAHQAGSHAQKGWEEFTNKVIQAVQKNRVNGVVFLAWGSPAAKRVENVDKNIHLVLKSVHPSPLSASRGFFNCGHFKKTNEWLSKRYGDEGVINWDCLSTDQTGFSEIPVSLLNNHADSVITTPKIHSDSQRRKKNNISLSQEELTAMESSITLEELDDNLSSDHSKSDKE